MRFKSKQKDGFQVFAVAGVNTVSFALTATAAAREGLLGFAVQRIDPAEDEDYFMYGYKVFESIIPHPDENTKVSTWEHPVQSFVWDDFTAKPAHEYTYRFHPVRGKPKKLDRSAHPVEVAVKTEPLFSQQSHDVFFNRGVASSQAYRREFHNLSPDQQPTKARREKALAWLTRELDDALLKFIARARKNDALLCCFYEFRYLPVAQALKKAIDRGVDVRIIVDMKENQSSKEPAFPREENLKMIALADLPEERVTFREAKPNNIAHNKFMVRCEGAQKKPMEVWTGSTNISLGAFAGQTNVGHWVRDEALAAKFKEYWDLLSTDPGPRKGDDLKTVLKENKLLRGKVEAIFPAPSKLDEIPKGVVPIFSPRSGEALLDLYFELVDSARKASSITLAFGINKKLKDLLVDNTPQNALIFMLLEKEDRPGGDNAGTFVTINASNNVYKAWGSYIEDPLYQWARETNARELGLNVHVSYVHSKFLLRDPLSADPIVVTGSANFSTASTNDNDENMIAIRGNTRVADIYFTEFNRLFNHYYFRSVYESLLRRHENDPSELFLKETAAEWLVKYAPGTLRSKRVQVFAEMEALDGV